MIDQMGSHHRSGAEKHQVKHHWLRPLPLASSLTTEPVESRLSAISDVSSHPLRTMIPPCSAPPMTSRWLGFLGAQGRNQSYQYIYIIIYIYIYINHYQSIAGIQWISMVFIVSWGAIKMYSPSHHRQSSHSAIFEWTARTTTGYRLTVKGCTGR